jgi:hypothetical protein
LNGSICGRIKYESDMNPYIISCGSVKTRNITILAGDYEDCILTLCEVEVFTSSPPGINIHFSLQALRSETVEIKRHLNG